MHTLLLLLMYVHVALLLHLCSMGGGEYITFILIQQHFIVKNRQTNKVKAYWWIFAVNEAFGLSSCLSTRKNRNLWSYVYFPNYCYLFDPNFWKSLLGLAIEAGVQMKQSVFSLKCCMKGTKRNKKYTGVDPFKKERLKEKERDE